jgi:putative ABC transport system substrate-binding protein
MRRRDFIIVIAGSAIAWPLAAPAQRVKHIGILMPYAQGDPLFERRVQIFRKELDRLGWIDGSNIEFDERWTTDNLDEVRINAESPVNENPDAIITIGGRVIPVVMRLTKTIPIVIPGTGDPVSSGYVSNLARPGGNITGFTFFEISFIGKTLELLKQIAPAISGVAMIFNPDNPNAVSYRERLEAFAPSLGLEPITKQIHGLSDVEQVIVTLAERQNTGVFFPPDLTVTALRREVIGLVERYRLPAIYPDSEFVHEGGLASYMSDRNNFYRLAAGYVDRILRGEKPGDLPFQQPTKYELVINMKTAKALGLTVPSTVLATADEVIE